MSLIVIPRPSLRTFQRGSPPCRILTLNSACRNPLDNVFLAAEVEHHNGDDGHDQGGHDGAHVHPAIGALHPLDGDGDGAELVQIQSQVGKQEVVPDPHGLQDAHGDIGGLHNGQHHGEEGPQGGAAVDHGGFLNLNGDGLDEAAEHEHRQPRAKAQVDDHQPPGGAQAQPVCHQGEGEHHHLEGDHHGKDAQEVQKLGGGALHPGDIPGEHGGAEQDDHHGPDGHHHGPEDGLQEVVLFHGVGKVLQGHPGLLRGELEGLQVDKGLFLKGVDEDNKERGHVENGDYGEQYSGEPAASRFAFHYCCTSLERVIFSWMRPRATTRTKNTTALAWPTP